MKFSDKLIPPSDPITTWRWCIAVAVILLIANASAGRFQYAYAEDMAAQSEKIDRLLTLQIGETLRGLMKDKCSANGDREALSAAIEQYQLEYKKLTGSRYSLPECPT